MSLDNEILSQPFLPYRIVGRTFNDEYSFLLIRLDPANSLCPTLFFENINTTLSELFEEFDVARIALDCSTTLIPYLHQSRVSCVFDKKDQRLYKIPLHIPQSNYTNLNETIKKLKAPTLIYDEKHEDLVEPGLCIRTS